MAHNEGWAVVRASGTVVVDISPEATEDAIWNIALGWPSTSDIEAEKARGGRAFRCRLVEIEDRNA